MTDSAVAQELATLLEANALDAQSLLRLTPERSQGKRASFLHDVKALFLAHCFDRLAEQGWYTVLSWPAAGPLGTRTAMS